MSVLKELNGFLFEGASQPPALIIYSPSITSRLRYVCKFIFIQGLQINFELTDNENAFLQSKLPKLNYSGKTVEKAINVNPAGLLSQKGISQTLPQYKQNGNPLVFFSDSSDLGFDMFSAVFFCISRYEEWQDHKKDDHGRFELENSIFKKLGTHKMPIVDLWINELRLHLIQKLNIQLPQRRFKFISSIDVDNVFAYKAKPLYRQLGGAFKDLKTISERFATVFGGKKDPFDAYDYQAELSKKHNVPLIYFFLYRNNTKYDRTIDPNHPEFMKLLSFLKQKEISVGLHPSYYSSNDNNLLKEEIEMLSKNFGSDIIASRQHFLRFNIKSTPKQLEAAGIRFDFTMGFASGSGFRAGTTLPFYYYDLEMEKELNIIAVPFAAMDGAYYIYKNTGTDQAYAELMQMANSVKAVNGLFITVIHDRSFSEILAPGWRNLYLKLHENLKN